MLRSASAASTDAPSGAFGERIEKCGSVGTGMREIPIVAARKRSQSFTGQSGKGLSALKVVDGGGRRDAGCGDDTSGRGRDASWTQVVKDSGGEVVADEVVEVRTPLGVHRERSEIGLSRGICGLDSQSADDHRERSFQPTGHVRALNGQELGFLLLRHGRWQKPWGDRLMGDNRVQQAGMSSSHMQSDRRAEAAPQHQRRFVGDVRKQRAEILCVIAH